MNRAPTTPRAAIACAALMLLACEWGSEEDSDEGVTDDQFDPPAAQECDSRGVEVELPGSGGVLVYAQCASAGGCELHDGWSSSLRADFEIDLSGMQPIMVELSTDNPEAAWPNGSPSLERDVCSGELRGRFQLVLLRPGQVRIAVDAATDSSTNRELRRLDFRVADPADVDILREDGETALELLELREGESATLRAAVLDAEGAALTTLGSERWWPDDPGVVDVVVEGEEAPASDPPLLPALGSRITLTARAAGETDLHVLAGNVERTLHVRIAP